MPGDKVTGRSSDGETYMTIYSDHLSEEELSSRLCKAKNVVEVGAVYIHTKSQKHYRVINLAFLEASQEIAV
ncbi:MAG: hypothetical protein K2V38_01705, partial [Gemmataceae bacterium]|nr:hypothetical protein [Gemmataceae bacterium]